MVLALPFLHPLAEARAAQNGLSGIICTQFGIAKDAGDGVPIGAADDGPCVILCAGMAGGKNAKALMPTYSEPLLRYPVWVHARVHNHQDAVRSNVFSGKTGIRGPPHSI